MPTLTDYLTPTGAILKIKDLQTAVTRLGAMLAAASIAEAQAYDVGPETSGIMTFGYAAYGDGGHGIYTRADVEPSHALKFQTVDGAWWELQPTNGAINVKQAGAKGDGVTNDHGAFMNAITFKDDFQHGTDGIGLTIDVVQPDQYYLLEDTIDLITTTYLRGHGFVRTNQPMIMFAQDTIGFVINQSDTTMRTTRTAGTSAVYSRFENLSIGSLGSSSGGPNALYPGIKLRTKAFFREVSVHGFPGHGWEIVCDLPGTDDTKGNSNYSSFQDCKAWWNGLSGFHIDGNNANAMAFFNTDCQSNGRFGVYDDSFLGNHYHSWHLSNNGHADRGYNTSSQTNRCVYAGNNYYAHFSATEGQLRTTQPGTDENVWKLSNSISASITWTGSNPVGTFHAGAPYALVNVNARGIVVGGYVEGGQVPSHIEQRWVVWAGIHGSGAGTYGEGFRWNGESWQGDFGVYQPEKEGSRECTVTLMGRNDLFWRVVAEGDDPNGLNFRWNETSECYEFRHGTSDPMLQFSCDITGGGAIPLAVSLPKGFILGPDNREHRCDAGAPASGTWSRGSIRWDPNPSAGGKMGWVCVVSGTPGTWKQFGAIDP